jgi:hypothetical protein
METDYYLSKLCNYTVHFLIFLLVLSFLMHLNYQTGVMIGVTIISTSSMIHTKLMPLIIAATEGIPFE